MQVKLKEISSRYAFFEPEDTPYIGQCLNYFGDIVVLRESSTIQTESGPLEIVSGETLKGEHWYDALENLVGATRLPDYMPAARSLTYLSSMRREAVTLDWVPQFGEMVNVGGKWTPVVDLDKARGTVHLLPFGETYGRSVSILSLVGRETRQADATWLREIGTPYQTRCVREGQSVLFSTKGHLRVVR